MFRNDYEDIDVNYTSRDTIPDPIPNEPKIAKRIS